MGTTFLYQNMPGKFTTDSRPGTALERKFSTFENYQTRVADECTQIINEKLREKITELDELCMSGSFNISRLDEIREYTSTSVTAYLAECKRLQKKAEKAQGGGNPLLQLLAGGMGGGAQPEEGEEMYEPEDEEEAAEIALPKQLLLSKMALDENNKIKFKLSLELDLPEKKKEEKKSAEKREIEEKQDEEEPEAKKPKRNTRSARKNKKAAKGGGRRGET